MTPQRKALSRQTFAVEPAAALPIPQESQAREDFERSTYNRLMEVLVDLEQRREVADTLKNTNEVITGIVGNQEAAQLISTLYEIRDRKRRSQSPGGPS